MKALVLAEYNHLRVEGAPRPEPGDTGVLVAVKACGICGSDVHGMDGSTGRRQPPVIMGHEAAGVIAEVGRRVQGWTPGDRVTFDSTIYCGQCSFCRKGLVNLCDRRRVLGVSCDEYRQDGAFAEFVAVPAHILYRLPDEVSFIQASMVEPVSVAVHAVGRTPVTLDDTAVVVGAGMIGLLIIQALRAAGCGRIAAVDLDPKRLELARKLGASSAIKADEADVQEEILRWTAGRGADRAFEAVGGAETLTAAIQSVRKGGSATLVGNASPSAPFPLQRSHVWVLGISTSVCVP